MGFVGRQRIRQRRNHQPQMNADKRRLDKRDVFVMFSEILWIAFVHEINNPRNHTKLTGTPGAFALSAFAYVNRRLILLPEACSSSIPFLLLEICRIRRSREE